MFAPEFGQDSRTHLGIARLVCEKVMNWATEKTGGLVGSSWELELLNMSSGCKKWEFHLKI